MKPTERDPERKKAREIMFGIGRKLLEERKNEISSMKEHRHPGNNLLSLLLRANTGADVPEHQRLTDEEVVARKSQKIITIN
jgi:cytochrome P450